MRELPAVHLGAPHETSGPSVAEALQRAFEEARRQGALADPESG